MWYLSQFPSLTGVIRFLITEFIHVETAQDNVSVPYRGYSFFNCRRCAYISVVWFVSVPYRGYSFFNMDKILIYSNNCNVSVPYRGSSFFNFLGNLFFQCFLYKFPSLTGVIRFLILPSKTRMITWLKMRFAGQNYF